MNDTHSSELRTGLRSPAFVFLLGPALAEVFGGLLAFGLGWTTTGLLLVAAGTLTASVSTKS